MDRDLAPIRMREYPTLAWRIGTVVLAIIFLAIAWGVIWATGAHAHDAMPTAAAPQGWSYPFSCCAGYDCREVPADWVTAGRDGYTIVITGEVLGYQDTRLRDSPDGTTHWCSVAGANNSRTICLYLPPKAY